MTIRLILALALFVPLNAASQEITAIGFVEDSIRLAFVRTENGWEPSCFFRDHDQANLLSDGSACASEIMARSWQIFDPKQGAINVGPLKPIEHNNSYSRNTGLVGYTLPPGVSLEFNQSAESRYTWMGKSPPPLIALPNGTKISLIDSKPAQMPEKRYRNKLIDNFLHSDRFIYTCEHEPEYKVNKRPAVANDVQITPVSDFSNSITFYEVSLKIDENSQCDILDNEAELMAVKDGRVSNLAEPFRKFTGAFSTSLTLLDGYQVSTETTRDTIFIAFIGGYNLDGYALVDAELGIQAISTWSYH